MSFPDDAIEALKRAYAALNRGEAAGFTATLDAAVERVEFGGSPQGGTFHGLDAVRAHVAQGRATWAEGEGCVPEQFIVAGDRIVVLVQVRVRLKDEPGWRVGRIGDVYTFRHGKAVEFRTFADVQQALDWAKRRPSGAPGAA